jgi:predicted RND superfamily exporter protein
MGYSGVSLDSATMMIASIAIGIGIDYSIHFSSRFRIELKQQPDELSALDKTLETTGMAIVINALTVALGFIILLGSNILPMQRFGWLIALTMAVSACAALTFLPASILVFRKKLFNNN